MMLYTVVHETYLVAVDNVQDTYRYCFQSHQNLRPLIQTPPSQQVSCPNVDIRTDSVWVLTWVHNRPRPLCWNLKFIFKIVSTLHTSKLEHILAQYLLKAQNSDVSVHQCTIATNRHPSRFKESGGHTRFGDHVDKRISDIVSNDSLLIVAV